MTQKEALEILKLGHNVFLTGAAGSGKTHVLQNYINYLNDHKVEVAVTASTGIAATHIGGTTIHSWSGLGVRSSLSEREIDELEEKQYLWKRYEAVKVLIIDEVSMLHHFRFDLLDRLCRSFKRNAALPFGGIQIVLCGDFFQLPPVRRSDEPAAEFIHASAAWPTMDLRVCYLSEQYRQNDKAYLEVLSSIRSNDISQLAWEHLQSRMDAEIDSKVSPTKLYTHNIDVDIMNNKAFDKIPGEIKEYRMTSKGREALVESLKKSCLAPEVLRLKIGAKVMFVKNNYDKNFVNGTLGTVIGFDVSGLPIVETFQGVKILTSPETWRIEEEGKTKAEISQLPLRLAWAITVHKSQGMSLDAAEMDLSKAFEKGMGYVALSRVRNLKGLKLLGINQMALKIDPKALAFDQELKGLSIKSQEELKKMSKKEIAERQAEFLAKVAGSRKQKEKKIPTEEQTKELILRKLSVSEMAEARGVAAETIVRHLEDLRAEDPDLDIQYLFDSTFTEERFEKIEKAFKKSFDQNKDHRLAPVKYLLGSSFSYLEIRLARLFLDIK